MNGKSLLLAALVSLSLAAPQSVIAGDDSAIHQMAKIVMHLNHYPNEGDKAKLKDIASHGSATEKTMANALLHMQHRVSADDKSKLDAIAQDSSLSEHERDLAQIIGNIKHKASKTDKKRLKEM